MIWNEVGNAGNEKSTKFFYLESIFENTFSEPKMAAKKLNNII